MFRWSRSTDVEPIEAVLFSGRVLIYENIIDAAQDKILALIKNMNSAIENHFSEAKKAKGGAA